jgi:hypothetical protein
MDAFNRAALSVSFIVITDNQKCRSATTEVAMDLPAHTADACVRWRLAPEILEAISISSPNSSVLPVVRRDREAARKAILLAAATACTPREKNFPTSWAVSLSLVVGNVGFLDDGQELKPGTRYTARASSSLGIS